MRSLHYVYYNTQMSACRIKNNPAVEVYSYP